MRRKKKKKLKFELCRLSMFFSHNLLYMQHHQTLNHFYCHYLAPHLPNPTSISCLEVTPIFHIPRNILFFYFWPLLAVDWIYFYFSSILSLFFPHKLLHKYNHFASFFLTTPVAVSVRFTPWLLLPLILLVGIFKALEFSMPTCRL